MRNIQRKTQLLNMFEKKKCSNLPRVRENIFRQISKHA